MIPTLEINSYEFLQPETHIMHFQIINKVFWFYSVPSELRKVKSRKRELVIARQVSMYFVRRRCIHMSLKEIGSFFDQHHTSVLNGIKAVEDQLSIDKRFKANLEYLENRLP